MPSKKKGGKKKQVETGDDDDWESALNEFAAESPKAEETKPKEEPPAEKEEEEDKGAAGEAAGGADDAAAAFLAGLGGDEGGGDKKKKKKKKKKDKDKEPAEKKETAAGKRLREMQEKAKAAQEKLAAEEAEERRKFEEREEARQAEIKKKEDEKQRIKDKKAAKIAKQKADGTYMTKKQKEQEAKRIAARAQMEAAGMVPTGGQKKKPMYGNNKRKQQKKKKDDSDDETVVVVEAPPPEAPKEEPKEEEKKEEEEESSGDDWDNDDFEVSVPVVKNEQPEDELEIEAAKEKERLRVVGLEKARKAKAEEERIAKLQEDLGDDLTKEELEAEQRKEESRIRREEREEAAKAARSRSKLRSPICCIMGHVDTGKTKLLDKIRNTNVQDGEAGGITQQIGATFFPVENIKTKTKKLNETFNLTYNLPGLLIIDTPGHESFSNLRSRGSSLCDIAILVIDIMHGLEPQTIESLNMLRDKKAPFVVALNKVDRLYDWKINKDSDIRASLAKQPEHVIQEFHDRTKGVITQLMEQGLNAALYYDNMKTEDLKNRISVIPTREGIPDMLLLLVQLTQQMMAEKLMFSSTLSCTILEVKVIEGLGTTIDCILVNGALNRGDTIVVATTNGPCATVIREILTPQPMREMRVKGDYVHHANIEAAMGVKLLAPDLENAIAGTSIWQVAADDDVEEVKEAAEAEIENVMQAIPKNAVGVHVQASTLGALEALIDFLNPPKGRTGCDPPIPISGCSIGPVFKKDVLRASLQLSDQNNPDFAVILAFDVPVKQEAAQMAEELGVKVFTADIIYHLFDRFTEHMDELRAQKREAVKNEAIFPSICRILPNCIFNKKDPIVLGVHVEQGILKVGTPLCVPAKQGFLIGTVIGIENNHKPVDLIKKGHDVAVSIQAADSSTMYGRQFDHKDPIYSKLSRESINLLKEHFRDDLGKEEWKLVIKLKKVFQII